MFAVTVSWSGGKDSALMLAALLADPPVRVAGLLTHVTPEGVSAHGVPAALIRRQAEVLGLPLRMVEHAAFPTNEAYEAALAEALAAEPVVETLAYGDLFLADLRAYREALAERLGVGLRFPLWGLSPETISHRVLAAGYRAVVVAVDTRLLDASFAGRPYDAAFLRDLPETVDPAGECGAFHTFVYDGPLFSEAVPFSSGPVAQKGRFAYASLSP